MSDHKLKEQIKRLNQIGIALTSETRLPTLLELIVREVRGFTRADAGSLYSVDRNQLRFEVAQNDTVPESTANAIAKTSPPNPQSLAPNTPKRTIKSNSASRLQKLKRNNYQRPTNTVKRRPRPSVARSKLTRDQKKAQLKSYISQMNDQQKEEFRQKLRAYFLKKRQE